MDLVDFTKQLYHWHQFLRQPFLDSPIPRLHFLDTHLVLVNFADSHFADDLPLANAKLKGKPTLTLNRVKFVNETAVGEIAVCEIAVGEMGCREIGLSGNWAVREVKSGKWNGLVVREWMSVKWVSAE